MLKSYHANFDPKPKHKNIKPIFFITNRKGKDTLHNIRKTVIAFGVVLLFAVGFMFLGMFIDIQIILKRAR